MFRAEGSGVGRHAKAGTALFAQPLKLVSYNVQVGIESGYYRHYITNSWKHVLPFHGRAATMMRVARHLREFDIVALQEVDAGSSRTRFVNQTEFLARHANFPVWAHQVNRAIGPVARHSNGLLLREWPDEVQEHVLPGMSGRGALVARIGRPGLELTVIVVHLALGRRTRRRQMRYLESLVDPASHTVIMGDFNCTADCAEMSDMLEATHLSVASLAMPTFPSWKPRRALDHVLISNGLKASRAWTPPWAFSDHLPVATQIELATAA